MLAYLDESKDAARRRSADLASGLSEAETASAERVDKVERRVANRRSPRGRKTPKSCVALGERPKPPTPSWARYQHERQRATSRSCAQRVAAERAMLRPSLSVGGRGMMPRELSARARGWPGPAPAGEWARSARTGGDDRPRSDLGGLPDLLRAGRPLRDVPTTALPEPRRRGHLCGPRGPPGRGPGPERPPAPLRGRGRPRLRGAADRGATQVPRLRPHRGELRLRRRVRGSASRRPRMRSTSSSRGGSPSPTSWP